MLELADKKMAKFVADLAFELPGDRPESRFRMSEDNHVSILPTASPVMAERSRIHVTSITPSRDNPGKLDV